MLHVALIFTTAFLTSFGSIGLLRFGDDVSQIATEDLPEHMMLTKVIRGCLVVAILCTYPLQLFPVLQVAERYMFGNDVPEFQRRLSHDLLLSRGSEPGDDPTRKLLYPEKDGSETREGGAHRMVFGVDVVRLYGPQVAHRLGRTVLLRTCLVAITATVAILAGDNFSYIAAIVGSIGATTLSFIMPGFLHYKLFGPELSSVDVAKDISIAAIGAIGGACGLVTTAMSW